MKPLLGQEWSNSQPRYIAYCLEHNAASPDAMVAFDRLRYPGGFMGGYIIWNSRKWREWAEIFGADLNYKSQEDHDHFSNWLLGEAITEWLLLEYEPSPRSLSH